MSAVNSWFEKLEERKLLSVTWNVNPGGPYSVNEGDAITIAATASVTNSGDVSDHITKYEWDTNFNGTFHRVVQGSNFVFFSQDDFASPHSLALRVTDADGNTTIQTTTLMVNAIPPNLTLTGAAFTNEGASYSVNFAAEEFGTDAVSNWAINWGDGSSENFNPDATSANHTFAHGPNDYTITATATDRHGDHSITLPVTVRDVTPTIAITGNSHVNEGTSYTVGLSDTDAGGNDLSNWLINWGDGHTTTIAGNATSDAHTYQHFGTYTVTATGVDPAGNFADTLHLTVDNVAPTVSINGNPGTSNEGSGIHFTSNASDAGAGDTLTYAWTVIKGGQTIATNATQNFNYTPTTFGTYTVGLSVSDDGGLSAGAEPGRDGGQSGAFIGDHQRVS